MSLLTRMLLREMVLPFLFSFFALSALLLLGRLLPLMEAFLKAGITLKELGTFVMLLFPSFWFFIVPMATLLGVLLGYLRLSRDSEMLALLASGVKPFQLLKPVIAVAILAWGISLLVAAEVLPKAKLASKAFIRSLTERTLARGIPDREFISPISGLTLYVHESLDDGRRLQGVFIRDSRREEVTTQILARQGELLTLVDGSEVGLRLSDGTLHRVSDDLKTNDTLEFGTYALRLSLGNEAFRPRKGELGMAALGRIAFDENIPRQDRLRYLTEFHKRLAVPTGALILAVMAAPLGIFFGRTGLSGGVALGLVAFLIYYLALALVKNVAETGTFSPGIALWVPNGIFAVITVGLLILLNRRGPLRG